MMNKVRLYRVFGSALLVLGLGGYLVVLCIRGFRGRLHFTATDVSGALTGFVLNIPVWAGLFLLWRADKNQQPMKKSIWPRVMVGYGILGALVIGTIIGVFVALLLLWEMTSVH